LERICEMKGKAKQQIAKFGGWYHMTNSCQELGEHLEVIPDGNDLSKEAKKIKGDLIREVYCAKSRRGAKPAVKFIRCDHCMRLPHNSPLLPSKRYVVF